MFWLSLWFGCFRQALWPLRFPQGHWRKIRRSITMSCSVSLLLRFRSCGAGRKRTFPCKSMAMTGARVCCACWMIPRLRANVGCIVSTTSRCWPTPWCLRDLQTQLWSDSGRSRVKGHWAAQSREWLPRWIVPIVGLHWILSGELRQLLPKRHAI